MKIINKNKFDQLMFLGDIHGAWGVINYYINKYSINNSVIIQVGDFGIGFDKKNEKIKLKFLNEKLVLSNIFLYVVRGNHDDPNCFNNWQPFSNILFMEDYSILSLNINDKIENILCIGGAISIDRKDRMINKSWWKDEVLVWKEELFPTVEDNITRIITHTAPDTVAPIQMGEICYQYGRRDKPLINDLIDERRLMTSLANTLIDICGTTLKGWYYGHFHFSEKSYYKHTNFKLLNIDELCPIL